MSTIDFIFTEKDKIIFDFFKQKVEYSKCFKRKD